jgi:cobalamin biosynthesis Mg chelatase CobN
MALNQEQETIAQAIANSGNPHAAGIHSVNYRNAAQKYNIQKNQELETRIQAVRTELQNHVSTTWANVSTQKSAEISQITSTLRSEISKLNTDLSLKHATLVNECNMSKNRCEELSGDVKFVRHELKSVGDKFTTLNHFVTNKNKEIILVIESLQKEVQLLKTPPTKVSYTIPILGVLALLILIGIGWWATQPNYLMLEY